MSDEIGLIIPWSIAQSKMTPAEKLIAGAVIAMSGADGICDASNEEIACVAGLSRSTVSNSIISMAKLGTMKIGVSEPGGNPKTCRIIVVPQILIGQCTDFGRDYRLVVNKTLKTKDHKTTVTMTKKDTHLMWKRQILYHMNSVLGLEGVNSIRTTIGMVSRFNDGANLEDCLRIIDYKFAEWGNDDYMSQYIRPKTLFSATHFPEYLRMANMWDEKGRRDVKGIGGKSVNDEIKIELTAKIARLKKAWLLLGEEYSTIEIDPDKTDAHKERMLEIAKERDELHKTAEYATKRKRSL